MDVDEKELLNRYLRRARADLLAKLDGLGEREVRWPMTGTGTNLLGLVKHVASVEVGYFGEVFGRPFPDLPWFADGAPADADLWVPQEESREQILALQAESVALVEATVAELPLDAVGHVPWWGDRGRVTLRQIMVHVGSEVARHAGHADILRELIDGRAGNGDANLTPQDAEAWAAHRARIERAAEAAGAAASAASAVSAASTEGPR